MKCDNILTPEGLKFLQEIDDVILKDPNWPKVCLLESETSRKCASDTSVGGKIAKASPIDVFKFAYGNDLSEITQYGIDIALFGLASSESYFFYTIPFFSKEYNRFGRKAKKVRIVLQLAGPIDMNGVRYNNMGDRTADLEYEIASW